MLFHGRNNAEKKSKNGTTTLVEEDDEDLLSGYSEDDKENDARPSNVPPPDNVNQSPELQAMEAMMRRVIRDENRQLGKSVKVLEKKMKNQEIINAAVISGNNQRDARLDALEKIQAEHAELLKRGRPFGGGPTSPGGGSVSTESFDSEGKFIPKQLVFFVCKMPVTAAGFCLDFQVQLWFLV